MQKDEAPVQAQRFMQSTPARWLFHVHENMVFDATPLLLLPGYRLQNRPVQVCYKNYIVCYVKITQFSEYSRNKLLSMESQELA